MVEPYRLVGAVFTGTTTDSNYWSVSASGSAATTQGNNMLSLTSGTGINASATMQSARIGRYVGSSANRFRGVIRLTDTGASGNTRRWGAFSTTDGAFFELSGTTFRIVTRKTGVDTQVDNGNFNGEYGGTYNLDTSVHTWEIYWTNSKIWFAIGDELWHTVSATGTTWSDTCAFPVRIENTNGNAGASGSGGGINARVATISRLGRDKTEPTSKYSSSASATTLCKIGPGTLHRIILGTCSNNATITIYDNITAAGTPIALLTNGSSAFQPSSLDFGALPFFNGLTVVQASANSNITIVYE